MKHVTFSNELLCTKNGFEMNFDLFSRYFFDCFDNQITQPSFPRAVFCASPFQADNCSKQTILSGHKSGPVLLFKCCCSIYLCHTALHLFFVKWSNFFRNKILVLSTTQGKFLLDNTACEERNYSNRISKSLYNYCSKWHSLGWFVHILLCLYLWLRTILVIFK